MLEIVLSIEAKLDIKMLYEFGERNYGFRGADDYYNRLNDKLELLARYPHLGITRPDIKPDIRCLVCGSHLILYKAESDRIFIARVLHHSVDVVLLANI
jgi:toxin ParE1/3/4